VRFLLFLAAAVLGLAFVAPAPSALIAGARTATPAAPTKAVRAAKPAGPLALAWPAKGRLTDDFGPRWGRQHRGIDIGILRTLRLRAAADGVVRKTGYIRGYEGYGQVVILDVGRGFKLLYAHLSRVDVRRGQHLERGQRLGLAGCTGSCTGTHLHFEVHKRGRALDPMPFLQRYTRSHKGG
jgi:murein DD-endopeptidase MepM/ murein hydrolase activator NlpD